MVHKQARFASNSEEVPCMQTGLQATQGVPLHLGVLNATSMWRQIAHHKNLFMHSFIWKSAATSEAYRCLCVLWG